MNANILQKPVFYNNCSFRREELENPEGIFDKSRCHNYQYTAYSFNFGLARKSVGLGNRISQNSFIEFLK